MKLLPLQTPELLEQAAGWLAQECNYQWLDFGGGLQLVTPAILRIMVQRDAHFIRVYTGDGDRPIGIVALNSVDRRFGTATLWGVTGEKSFANRGHGTYAGSKFLTLAFRELGLRAINTWLVEHNPSRRVIERLNFRYVGRQRQCHLIDGRAYDRLFYDLLWHEHREQPLHRPRRSRRASDRPYRRQVLARGQG